MLFGRKAIWQTLHSVLKITDITLLTKVHIVKAMIFPTVMYECASWTIKKAACQRTDAFELRCWRRFLRVPWTARRSNQLILKEINSKYPLEGLMLIWSFNALSTWLPVYQLEKTLMLGKIEGRRRRGQQKMRWFDGYHQLNEHEFEQTLGDSEGQESLVCCSPWGHIELDTTERWNNKCLAYST